MYRGTNPTAIQSQKMISYSLIELMTIKAYSQIYIKQICENGRVSRQTFYSLFCSKNDVIEYTLHNRLQEHSKVLVFEKALSLSLLIDYFSHWLFKEEALLKLIIRNGLSHIFSDFMKRTILNLRERLGFSPHNATERIDRYQLAYISGALSEVFILYLKSNDPFTPRDFSQMVTNIVKGEHFSRALQL